MSQLYGFNPHSTSASTLITLYIMMVLGLAVSGGRLELALCGEGLRVSFVVRVGLGLDLSSSSIKKTDGVQLNSAKASLLNL